jgi:hypothetical protein
MKHAREVHLELLLGRRVVDRDGRPVGRIEEMIAELHDGEWYVVRFVLGKGGLMERIFGRNPPRLARLFVKEEHRREVVWRDLDLSDAEHPRLLPLRNSSLPNDPSDDCLVNG